MDCLTKDLRELYERAKGYQQNQAPSPCYSTGLIDGFYGGVRYVFDKIAEQSNDPLTLEELRGMDGEAVWVVPLNDFDILPANYLVNAYEEQIVVDKFGAYLDFEDYGKTWLAYRRRPEEGTQ